MKFSNSVTKVFSRKVSQDMWGMVVGLHGSNHVSKQSDVRSTNFVAKEFWHGSHSVGERASARDKRHERQRDIREGHARSEAVPVMLQQCGFLRRKPDRHVL